MRNNLILAFSIIALLTLSCQRNEISAPVNTGNEVSLVGAVGKPALGLQTKSGILNPDTNTGEKLALSVVRAERSIADFNAHKSDPDYGLTFSNRIPSLPGAEPLLDGSVRYYSTSCKMDASASAGYRKIREFGVEQYFASDDQMLQYIAWYPQGTTNQSPSGTDSFKITETLDLQTDVIYSQISNETLDKSYRDTLLFDHALCQFRIFVYRMKKLDEFGNETAEGVDCWGELNDMELLNQPGSLTLTLPNTIEYDGEKTEFKLSDLARDEDEGNGVYFIPSPDTPYNIPVGIENKTQISTFLAAPPENGDLQLRVTTGIASSKKAISIANDFKAGCAYNIVLAFSDHGIVSPEISVCEWTTHGDKYITNVDAVMYYDLSRYGTANCYLVTSANTGYTFKGNVMGCGNELGGGTIVGVDDCSISDGHYVDVIYCEPEGLIELQGNTLMDGDVIFTVPGAPVEPGGKSSTKLVKKGNAIIGLYDREGGNLLWSWHIWVTDPPIEQMYNNGYKLQDRNVGATEVAGTAAKALDLLNNKYSSVTGFFYQWGRKDPMIPGLTTISHSAASIAEANAAGPLTYFGAGSKHWRDDLEVEGKDKATFDASWGFRENQDIVKTIYDPCPPGYRMAETKAWTTDDDLNRKLNVYQQSENQAYIYGNTTPSNKSGIYKLNNNMFLWYPGTGWLDHAYLGTLADGAPVVVADNTGDTGNRDSNNYTSQKGAVFDGYNEGGMDGGIVLTDGSNTVDACPVRCVSVNVTQMVNDLSKDQTANCYIVSEGGDYKFKADIRGNGVTSVSVGGNRYSVFDKDPYFDDKDIFYTVLWWQGDLATGANNSKGTDCPIKFVNNSSFKPTGGLPATSSNGGPSDFTDDDLGWRDDLGYLQFHIEADKYAHGNAVIAAFDCSNGQILWSWHIWLSEQPGRVMVGPATIPDYDGYGEQPSGSAAKSPKQVGSHDHAYYVMDRNLGATFAAENEGVTGNEGLATLGFYYQWGRKDPFPGPASINTTNGNTSSWYQRNYTGNFSWSSAKNSLTVQSACTTREAGAESPVTFFRGNFSGTDYSIDNVNWHKTDWSAANMEFLKFSAMWGYPGKGDEVLYNPHLTKTVNDPCPPRYYMPHHYVFAAAGLDLSGSEPRPLNHQYNWRTGHSYSLTNDKTEVSWKDLYSGNYGIWLRANTTFNLNGNLWIPFSGYRSGNSTTAAFSNVGSVANMYYSVEYNSKYIDMGDNATVRSSYVTKSGGGQHFAYPSDALTVRCRAY